MNLKEQSKFFVSQTLDADGTPNVERAVAVCEYISQMDCSQEKKITLLKSYKKSLIPVLEKERIVAELSGEVSPSILKLIDEIVTRERGGRAGKIEFRQNPQLIGGVRLTIADTIVEHSAKLSLQNLKKQF